MIPTAPSRRLHQHRPRPLHPLLRTSGSGRGRPSTHVAVLGAVIAMALAVLPAGGCHVDREGFNQRVFACDTAAPDPGCGTDEDGRPMGCFAARQIGATDFCTKTCDVPGPTSGGICLPGGDNTDTNDQVELRSCHPSDDTETSPHGACHQSGLGCYRTDLLLDEGVCMTLNPCNQDGDCRDPVRSVCATSFLSTTIYPESNLPLDHMFCLQTNCKSRGTSCSPGETCLQEVVPPEAHAADICVPNCDSHQRCPPNFLCYKKASTSVAPNVCIPGLLGFTCESEIDCMVGTCNQTGIGYNVCTTTCGSEADCQRFDGEQGSFTCIKNPADPTPPGVCQTPDAYRGSICNDTADCVDRNPEEVCMRASVSDAQGVCLKPCPEDGTKCKPRGGINHTCLPSFVSEMGPASACFPGYLGYPCEDESNCVGGLKCLPSLPGAPNVCSAACATDAECVRHKPGRTGSRWAPDDTSWCGAGLPLNNPICLPGGVLPDESPCPSSNACASGKCTNGMCAPSTP